MRDAIAKVTNKIKKTIKSINFKSKKTLLFVGFFAFALATGLILISYGHYVEESDKTLIVSGYAMVSDADISLKIYIEDKNSSGNGVGTYSRAYYIPQRNYTYNESTSYCTEGITIDSFENGEFNITSTSKGYCKVYFDAVDGIVPSSTFKLYVEETQGVKDYEETGMLPDNDYVYVVNQTKTTCTDPNAVVEVVKRKIEVTTSMDTTCTVYVDIQSLTGGAIHYVSDTVVDLVSDTEYTSSQDGTPYVIRQETAVGPATNATYTKVNSFGTTKVYSATGVYGNTAVSGTDATGKLTMAADGTWTNNGTVTNTYYHAVMPIAEEGYYEICYTLGTGNTANYLQAYITDSANSTSGTVAAYYNANATNTKSGCTYIGYLTNEKAVRVVNRAYTSIASVSFYLQKTNDESDPIDAGIRYEGNDPDNYIEFNNGEEWRIIGTFEGSTIGLENGKQYTKIIRNTPMYKAWDEYQEDEEGNYISENDWTNSTLNTYLNGEYLQGLTDKTKIAKYNGNYSTWYLRGMTAGQNNVSTTNDWYMAERVTGGAGYRDGVLGEADETAKSAIALMYPSDYGYAAYGEGCSKETTPLGSYGTIEDEEVLGCTGVDWLLLEEGYEWLLSPYLGSSDAAFVVHVAGGGYVYFYDVSDDYVVRPVLYLEAHVYITDGNGSKDDPYKIDL